MNRRVLLAARGLRAFGFGYAAVLLGIHMERRGLSPLSIGITLGIGLAAASLLGLASAWAASRKMNEFLAQNYPDRKAIIFSQRFWKLEGEDYTPAPTTSRVDMSKYTVRWRPSEGDEDFVNFDYGFFNEATGKWLHANHCDPVVLGSACDVAGRMIVKESTLEYYSKPLKDFNTQVFCVGISTLK